MPRGRLRARTRAGGEKNAQVLPSACGCGSRWSQVSPKRFGTLLGCIKSLLTVLFEHYNCNPLRLQVDVGLARSVKRTSWRADEYRNFGLFSYNAQLHSPTRPVYDVHYGTGLAATRRGRPPHDALQCGRQHAVWRPSTACGHERASQRARAGGATSERSGRSLTYPGVPPEPGLLTP